MKHNNVFEALSSAQRELGKGLPTNASSTAPPAGSVENAIRPGLVAVDQPRPTPHTGPYFDLMASKNVTALLGKTAYLNCRVKNLGNKTETCAEETMTDGVIFTSEAPSRDEVQITGQMVE
ncbi:unnamed protein product [Diatraea saccharalis]|uniref:Uncharacterized protein n=1 Tax=Diatraea saccharalis TaxID=40085 RepID=A0A9N9R7E1_9NEOP|nr:unnamed protein product [Diatraea saccharalis]